MLFNSTEQVRKILPISKNVEFSRLSSALDNAEEKFLLPLLGRGMYDELQEFFSANPSEPLTEVQLAMQELLTLCQKSIVHLAYYSSFEFLNVNITQTGFDRLESEKTKGLFKYQEDNLKEFFKNTGFNQLDTILEYLENNKQHFSEFTSTGTYTNLKGNFIRGTKQFNEIYYIGSSRLTFLRLVPYMKVVEDLTIKPLIGIPNFEEIKSEMLKDAPSDKVTNIIPLISKPIAFLSVALLMEDSGADLTEKGLYFSAKAAVQANNDILQPANKESILNLSQRSKNLGESYLQLLKQYLKDNSQEWNNYMPPVSGLHSRSNVGKRTFFA